MEPSNHNNNNINNKSISYIYSIFLCFLSFLFSQQQQQKKLIVSFFYSLQFMCFFFLHLNELERREVRICINLLKIISKIGIVLLLVFFFAFWLNDIYVKILTIEYMFNVHVQWQHQQQKNIFCRTKPNRLNETKMR